MTKKELFESATCPICEGREYEVIYKSNYPQIYSEEDLIKIYSSSSDHILLDQLVSCKECTLKYINPRPKTEIIARSYEEAIDFEFVKQNELRIQTFHKNFKNIIKLLKITPSRDFRILDVGCAGGAFPKVASDLGFGVVGVEPSRWMCNLSQEKYKLDIRQGTLEEQNFKKESFDMVSLWDVIEHLTRPDLALKEIKHILKPEGYLIVNYPDIDSFFSKILRRNWPFLLSVHLYYYNRITMRRQLETKGFEIINISSYWQSLNLDYVLQRAATYFRIFSLFEKFAKYLGIGNIHVTYNMGQNQFIAKKYL